MRKIIGGALMAIGVACSAGALILFYYYISTGAPHPNAATGQINELSNHGQVAYITAFEETIFWVLVDAGIFLPIFGWIMQDSARRYP